MLSSYMKHSDTENTSDWASEWKGLVLLSHNTSLSSGVALLFSQCFIPQSYDVEEVLKERLLKVRACLENEVFVFICVYASTLGVERVLFLNTLSTVTSSC